MKSKIKFAEINPLMKAITVISCKTHHHADKLNDSMIF